MRKVVITHGNVLTPLGDLDNTWNKLLAGESGIIHQEVESLKGSFPLGIIDGFSARLGSVARQNLVLEKLLSDLPPLPEKTQLICATTKAAVDELITGNEGAIGQPWDLGKELVSRLSLSCKPLTVSAACASGSLATINGAMRIEAGECDQVLVVAIDLISEFVLTGFDSLKALSLSQARPFDRKRDGLSLGDGAAWLLLSAADLLDSETSELAQIDSFAVSCDATHITAPCRYGSGLKAAMKQLESKRAVAIGGINAHGTGTVFNDAMELVAFDASCVAGTPVCSVKGALGHSLGACGAVELLLSAKSIQSGVLPPTVCLQKPAETECLLSGEESLELLHPSVLTTNSGFGGINTAVLLSV